MSSLTNKKHTHLAVLVAELPTFKVEYFSSKLLKIQVFSCMEMSFLLKYPVYKDHSLMHRCLMMLKCLQNTNFAVFEKNFYCIFDANFENVKFCFLPFIHSDRLTALCI